MGDKDDGPTANCEFQFRSNPARHRESVRIGCGAGFAGDRPSAALRLLKDVPDMNYLVLECLAERTLSNRFDAMSRGGKGYDPRISKWMSLLLPVALQRGVCIITNMGAIDPLGAQSEVLRVAAALGLQVTVSVAYEVQPDGSAMGEGSSTYLGAAPIVHALETWGPDVVITSRTADAALFLAPMVFELGWNWDQYWELAQGALTGHLLECGCQLTGGYYMHPGDPNRNLSLDQLLHTSLPYADVSWNGDIVLAKPAGSGGELNVATCSQQLLYEIGDPSAYITPDVIIDINDVSFVPLSEHQVRAKGSKPASLKYPAELLRLVPEACGWKGWGEISYGGICCDERAAAADCLVRSWMEESVPGSSGQILSYVIGKNSLGITPVHQTDGPEPELVDVRLRMDGLFRSQADALLLTEEFGALYTNGPAGGGGISTGQCKETQLHKILVSRRGVHWKAGVKHCPGSRSITQMPSRSDSNILTKELRLKYHVPAPAPGGVIIPLHQVAHGRTGDKGNQINVSLIPHFSGDIGRLKAVVSKEWVAEVMRSLVKDAFEDHSPLKKDGVDCKSRLTDENTPRNVGEDKQVDVYYVGGISALNLVIHNVLDGGVTCSRRIDRHGKSFSDLILCQRVTLPL